MGTLNRKKTFATVVGQAPYRYEQGGRLFNHEEREVDKDGNLIVPPQPVEVKTEKTADELELEAAEKASFEPEVSVSAEKKEPVEVKTEIDEQDLQNDGINMSREEIIEKLEAANIPYNPKSRRTKLFELLKGKEGA